ATADRCGFVEAARRLGDQRVVAALSLTGSQETGGLPAIGEVLGGYRLERVLGKGGMGAGYVGVNDAGMRRAVKIPIFAGEEASALRARFEREARAMASVPRHPNVLQIYTTGQERGFAYCVLDLVEGEGLDTLAARGALPIERALELAEQLARALAHVHAQ